MKIALIAPPYPLEEAPSPPLGLCYVASACEAAGAQVIILDYIVSKYSPEKLKIALDSFKPDIVGTTSVTMNFPQAISIIQDVKTHNPEIITMMGGPHVSFDIENTFHQYPQLDLIVVGEAEQTLSELIPVISSKSKWEHVRGLAFQREGRIFITDPRELIHDLDSLPLPARHLLPMSRYLALGFPVSIITSRGCPNKCIFCLGRRMVGFKGRFRTPEMVVDEIEHILSYGFTRINIADDLFTANKKRVLALCNEIKSRNVEFSWSAFARVNTVDVEILSVMKDAGCDSISFGIESGNPEMLKRIKKGITLDQARRAVQCCKEVDMITHASFMVGLPGETMETLADTSRFAKELGIAYGYHFLAPFPGTTVRENIEKYDLNILTDDWSLYDANRAVVQTSEVSPDKMESFVKVFDQEQEQIWRHAEQLYKENKCTPYEGLLIEGHKRMHLIYTLLSEDIVDDTQCRHHLEEDDPATLLSSNIALRTGNDQAFVASIIKDLIAKGYIGHESSDGTLSFYWTHNKFKEKSPIP
jgi:anaerobic magnesium-protoporphyrin IX monomethyl ester cyclase